MHRWILDNIGEIIQMPRGVKRIGIGNNTD
jgi:hypothetical protein